VRLNDLTAEKIQFILTRAPTNDARAAVSETKSGRGKQDPTTHHHATVLHGSSAGMDGQNWGPLQTRAIAIGYGADAREVLAGSRETAHICREIANPAQSAKKRK
jgi:hypothetical protein